MNRRESDLQYEDTHKKLDLTRSSSEGAASKPTLRDAEAYPPPLSEVVRQKSGALRDAHVASALGDGRSPRDRPASPPQNAIICEFAVDDPLKPTNFSSLKKARITALAVVFAILTGEQAETGLFITMQQLKALTAGLNIGMYTSSIEGLRTGMSGTYSDIEMQLGSTVWLVTVAVSPLALAPFSEWFYPSAIAVYGISALGQVYQQNLAALMVARAVSGLAAAVGNSMSAGSLADIYTSKTRGWMMSILSFSIFACMNSSLYIGAVINIDLGWAYVGWITFIVSMVMSVLYTLFLPETRANVILYKRKLRLEKETGREHFAAGQEERMASWRSIVTGSLTRPVFFLTNEPIVIAICVWLGFLWGVAILLLQAVPLVFREYGFSTAERGLAFLSLVIGAFIAFLGTFHQERLYQRDVSRAKTRGEKVKPESRLYHAMLGGIAFPIGTLIFAWGGRPSVPWVVPCIGLGIMGASIFPPYLSASIFLADTYEVYSSSAIACQSFSRNFTAGVYALFAKELYTRFPRPAGTGIDMSYALASTLIAAVGLVLGMVPFVLYRFGEYLRLRSRIASEIWALHEEEEEERHRRQ